MTEEEKRKSLEEAEKQKKLEEERQAEHKRRAETWTPGQLEAENRRKLRAHEAGERVRARGRDQEINKEAGNLNPKAAELVAGYTKRVQNLDQHGVRKAELDQMYAHMDKKGQWSTETTRKGNTALVWNGVDAGGNRRRMVLQTAQGTGHSVADFRNNPEKLKFVVDRLTENFGNAYAFVMNKPSGYQMTDQERLAKQKIDQTVKDLKTSGWAPTGGWSGELKPQKYSGPEFSKDEIAAAKEREDAKAEKERDKQLDDAYSSIPDGTGWDRDTSKGRFMTDMGINKEDWDKASWSEKKKMLAKAVYGDEGYGSARAKVGMQRVADYYQERQRLADYHQERLQETGSSIIDGVEQRNDREDTGKTRKQLADGRMAEMESVLGDDFMKEIGSRGRKVLRSTVESRVQKERDALEKPLRDLGKYKKDMAAKSDRWEQGAQGRGGTTWETYRRYYGLG